MFLYVLIVYSALACEFMMLPDDITHFSPFYDLTHTLQASSRFIMPLKSIQWYFYVYEPSWLRISADPRLFSLHLTLISSEFHATKSADHLSSAMISHQLSIRTYQIKLDIDAVHFEPDRNLDCDLPTVFINVALMPLTQVHELVEITDLYTKGFPEFQIESKLKERKDFAMSSLWHYIEIQGSEEVVYNVKINLNEEKGTEEGFWSLRLDIGHNFLIGGGLKVALISGSFVKDEAVRSQCLRTGSCIFSRRSQKNAHTLSGIFNKGEFSLVVYYENALVDEKLHEIINYTVPISVNFVLERVYNQEDHINCVAGVLLKDLTPFSSRGFIRFKDSIVADFLEDSVKTQFSIHKASSIKILTKEPQGLSVTIKLLDSNEICIEESEKTSLVSSLQSNLNKGSYYIEFSIDNSIKDSTENSYCEIFTVEIAVSPEAEKMPLKTKCRDSDVIDDILQMISEENWASEGIDTDSERIYEVQYHNGTLYETKIVISKEIEVYFEVFSDIFSDFVIHVKSKEGEGISEEGNRYAHARLKPGEHVINIGLMQRVSDETACVKFNLKVSARIIKDNKFSFARCQENMCERLPDTLNTLDKLGPKGTKQVDLPIITYYSNTICIHSSSKETDEKIRFTLEAYSRFKLFIESNFRLKSIQLSSSKTSISAQEHSVTQEFHTYSLSASLNPKENFELLITYNATPKNSCSLYTILIQISPISSPKLCPTISLDNSLIFHRTLSHNSILFTQDSGFSTNAPLFRYERHLKPFETRISFSIPNNSLILGYLMSNNFGLTMQLYQGKTLRHWGNLNSAYRHHLLPTPIDQGEYTLVFKDYFTSDSPECIEFNAALMIDLVSGYDNIQSLMRDYSNCEIAAMFPSFDAAGLLESGSLHWHQSFPMTRPMRIQLNLNQETIIRAFIPPKPHTTFKISILNTQKDVIKSSTINLHSDGFHEIIYPGNYFFQVTHTTLISLKHNCPTFKLDLEIMPLQKFSELSNLYDCKSSQSLELLQPLGTTFILYDSSQSEFELPLMIPMDALIIATFSYANIMSGHISLFVSNEESNNILQTLGSSNICQVSGSLPEGNYSIYLVNSVGNTGFHSCWPMMVSIYLDLATEVCAYGAVPARLTKKYGGPQEVDGSVAFYGEFKTNVETDVIFIEAPKRLKGRFAVVSLTTQVFIKIALYEDPGLTIEVKGIGDPSDLFVDLNERPQGYYFVIAYIGESSNKCDHFELRISLEIISVFSSLLECKIVSTDFPLPPDVIFLTEPTVISGNTYAIYDTWTTSKKSLPSGVTHTPYFIYTINLTSKIPGILSVETTYNFLTTHITIELTQNNSEVYSSHTESLSLNSNLNFGTLLTDISLPVGSYELLLIFPTASAILSNQHSSTSLCLPFEFQLEFLTHKVFGPNRVVQVEPDHLTDHNPSEVLIIQVYFEEEVESFSAYLLTNDRKQITVKKLKIVKNRLKAILQFDSDVLHRGKCYELKITMPEGDGLKHEYCMADCYCNPNANPICNNKLECLCQEPYKGPLCYECISGFSEKNSKCIELTVNSAEILELSFESNSVKKGDYIRLKVVFNLRPYDSFAKKITAIKGPNTLIEAFELVSRSGRIKGINVEAIGSDKTEWFIEFSSEQCEVGAGYTVEYQFGKIFDVNSREFAFNSEYPMVFIKPNVKGCSNGEIVKGECRCFRGYQGLKCEDCSKGFEKRRGKCDEKKNSVKSDKANIDLEAYVKFCRPEGIIEQDSDKEFTVEISLSIETFTSAQLPINDLTNSQYLANAFALTNSTKNLIFPISIISAGPLIWKFSFTLNNSKENTEYQLVQLDDMLFTRSGLSFSQPKCSLPKLFIKDKSNCNNHGVFNEICRCEKGWAGKNCQECGINFQDTNGICEEIPNSLIWEVIWYSLVYFLIGILVIYCVASIKKVSPLSEHEISHQQDTTNEIDLYKEI